MGGDGAGVVSKTLTMEVKMTAQVNKDECTGCGACVDACPESAIAMDGDIAVVDLATCTECGLCVDACPVDAITIP